MEQLQELVRLHRMKTGDREVARLLSVSPNTERQYRRALEGSGLLAGPVDEIPSLEVLKAAVAQVLKPNQLPPQQQSSIEPWLERVEKFRLRGLGPRAIYDIHARK